MIEAEWLARYDNRGREKGGEKDSRHSLPNGDYSEGQQLVGGLVMITETVATRQGSGRAQCGCSGDGDAVGRDQGRGSFGCLLVGLPGEERTGWPYLVQGKTSFVTITSMRSPD